MIKFVNTIKKAVNESNVNDVCWLRDRIEDLLEMYEHKHGHDYCERVTHHIKSELMRMYCETK